MVTITGRAAFPHLADEGPEIPAGNRVEAGGGLIEYDQLRVVDKAGGEGEALLLATGKLPDTTAGLVGQSDQVE